MTIAHPHNASEEAGIVSLEMISRHVNRKDEVLVTM